MIRIGTFGLQFVGIIILQGALARENLNNHMKAQNHRLSTFMQVTELQDVCAPNTVPATV